MSNINTKLCEEVDNLIKNAFKEFRVESNTMKKSFDEIETIKTTDADITIDANGGKDIVKNKDKKDKNMEDVKKVKDEMKKVKDDEYKSKYKKNDSKEDLEEDELEEIEEDELEEIEEDEGSEEESKKDAKKPFFKKNDMKKSFKVSEEDFQLLSKAKKDLEEKGRLEKVKSDPLYKSVEGLTSLIKTLNDQVSGLKEDINVLKKSPAREPKSLDGLTAIEKSQNADDKVVIESLKKSQVIDVLYDMQVAGKIQDTDLIEYDGTGKISNPSVRSAVNAELSKRFS